MKRILALILVLLLSLTAMVGCDKIPGLEGVVDKVTDFADKIPFIGDLINKEDKTPDDDIKYDVNAAKEFITQMYKDANPETKRNYDVAAQCLIEGVRYEITWAIEGTDVVTVQASSTKGFWTIVVPEKNEAAVNYKITATIKADDGTTATVSFDRVIPVVDNQGIVSDLKEGVAYKFFLDQNDAKVAQTLFAIGSTQNNENKFILTTTDPKKAPDFFAEKVEGGYKFYTMIDGVKNYVHCKTTVADDGKVSKYIGFATESNSVYTYETETNAWFTTIDGAKYVVGTYGTYKTICISEAKYITADNTGISQFPVSFMTSAYAETLAPDEEVEYKVPTLENAVAPVVGTAYNLGMIQGNKENGVYYLTGSLSGYYMATTDAVASAVNFYVEAVEGGYNLYTIVAGEKLYVNFVVSGTHVNGKYEATATTVYTYDATLKTFKTTVNDTAYILGTTASNTYTTVGPVKATELNFYMQFVVSTNADQEGTTPDTPVDPNPDTPAPTINYGTKDAPVTPTDAVNACKDFTDGTASAEVFYVKGLVKSIGETGNYYKKVYITDGTTELYIYTINMGEGVTGFAAGDTIIACGYVKNYQGNLQMSTNNNVYVNAIVVIPATPVNPPVEEECEHNFVDGICTKCKEADPNYVPPTVEPTVNYGTLEAPVTTTQAVNACKDFADGDVSAQPFYVTGTVTKIGATGSFYSQVYITDGTTELLIYTISMGEGITGFTKTDTITAYGYIKNYSGTIEMASHKADGTNNTYVYAVAVVDSCAAGHDFTEATCTVPKTCKVCGTTEGETAEHVYVDGKCACGKDEPTGEEPVAQGFYLSATISGTTYYFTGTVNGGKGAITTDVSKAATVYKEEVSGGFYLYILEGTTKKYINIADASTSSLSLTATPQVLKYYTGSSYTAIYNGTKRGLACYQGQDLRTYDAASASNFTGKNGAFALVAIA